MESAFTPEKVGTEDISIKPPEEGGTAIVVQRHAEYIRDVSDTKAGNLTDEAYLNAQEQSHRVILEMLSKLSEEERSTVDFLVIGSDTKYRDQLGQRSMETASASLEGVKAAIAGLNVAGSHVLNESSTIRGGSGPRPTPQLREPNMFLEAPDFVNFLEEKYGKGKEFWAAFEEDREKEEREITRAEGPVELGGRLASYINVLARYAKMYHLAHPHRRLIIWADSHYDTISPYVKQLTGKDMKEFLPVDYGGGFAIDISANGAASTTLQSENYEVPINTSRVKPIS